MATTSTPLSPSLLASSPFTVTGSGGLAGATLTGTLAGPNIQPRQQIVTNLIQDGYWVKATGSKVTTDGWTSESDWDYVVYDPDNTLYFKLSEDKSGWSEGLSGNGMVGLDFTSWKQGHTNLILVNKDAIWKKWVIATNLLRIMNPKTKEERIKLFDNVFGKTTDSVAVEF
jgi:hypothetical protein